MACQHDRCDFDDWQDDEAWWLCYLHMMSDDASSDGVGVLHSRLQWGPKTFSTAMPELGSRPCCWSLPPAPVHHHHQITPFITITITIRCITTELSIDVIPLPGTARAVVFWFESNYLHIIQLVNVPPTSHRHHVPFTAHASQPNAWSPSLVLVVPHNITNASSPITVSNTLIYKPDRLPKVFLGGRVALADVMNPWIYNSSV